jgi:hypothetical protein
VEEMLISTIEYRCYTSICGGAFATGNPQGYALQSRVCSEAGLTQGVATATGAGQSATTGPGATNGGVSPTGTSKSSANEMIIPIGWLFTTCTFMLLGTMIYL